MDPLDNIRGTGFVTALSLLPGLTCGGFADAADPDPFQTQQALAALFAASGVVIPLASTCRGEYGQRGKARIGDLLAVQFSYIYHGENIVSGHCSGAHPARCTVSINRAAGEDVSSATIDFVVRGGRLDPATLTCVMTP